MYFFIPDSSFVGTAFVHATSNILCTAARNAVLSLEVSEPVEILEVKGGVLYESPSWGVQVRLGNLQLGQRRDVVVRVKVPTVSILDGKGAISATWRFERCSATGSETVGVEEVALVSERTSASGTSSSSSPSCRAGSNPGVDHIKEQACRAKFVDDVREALMYGTCRTLRAAQGKVKELAAYMGSLFPEAARMCADDGASPTSHGPTDAGSGVSPADIRVAGLLSDVTGQVTEATARDDWFDRWGRHYLPSLIRAHQLQVCSNFKDPGVQHYGGVLFTRTKQLADAAFLKLPPPTPSIACYSGYGGSSRSRGPTLTSMAAYHNSSNPCFDGTCTVTMADGSSKRVQDVRAGDSVAAVVPNVQPRGGCSTATVPAKVACVVRTECADGAAHLCVFKDSGLRVTPYHPLRVQGKWSFPYDLARRQTVACPAVYSFVLEEPETGLLEESVGAEAELLETAARERVMLVNGVEAATLGHGIKGDPVASHAYFGSRAVVDDLRGMVGWKEGLVRLQPGPAVRDPDTGLVVGLRQVVSNSEN